MTRHVGFRTVECSGVWEQGSEQYADDHATFGYNIEFYAKCKECGRREDADGYGRIRMPTPHEKAMPDWARYWLKPTEQDDEDRACWWAAVAEVAALCGEDLGIVLEEQ
jgi:hypothetical protein